MRLIDADELKLELKWLEIDKPVYHDVMSTIDEMATVDAVEVVRCKDCKYAHMTYGGECKQCDNWVDDDDFHLTLYLDGDFYCAFGERREDDNK